MSIVRPPAEDIFDEEPNLVRAFIIGDPHFKAKNLEEGMDFTERALKAAAKVRPQFIVVLGDTLDTHEIVRVQPHRLACDFIEGLSAIAQVYLIIGNHDLINQTQFLTANHIFNPLKKWENVCVVDRPVYATYGVFSFVFCPYVEPGRFTEALDHLVKEGETWDLVDCIFAHQEFYGCKMGAITSEKGDQWDEDYPPVISGHIHDAQKVGENVFYPGSALQHAFGESPNKHLWSVTFTDSGDPFSVEKIHLGMKGKKIVYMNIEDVDDFDTDLLERYHIKLTLRGTSEQFRVFRRGKNYAELRKLGVRFSYDHTVEEIANSENRRSREQVSYLGVLKEVVKTKTQSVQDAYKDIVGGIDSESEICELVFEDDDDEDEDDYPPLMLRSVSSSYSLSSDIEINLDSE